jgi:HK97 gp10 family phage protein
MSVTLSVTGIKELDDLLKGLPKQLQHRYLQAAHADAAKPLIDRAQGNAPYKTGRLEESIGVIKPTLRKATEIGIVKVGPRRGGSYKGYHGHLIEFGHRIVTRKGKTVGKTNPKPFMRPAFEQTKERIQDNIGKILSRKLTSYMKKMLKNNA